MALEPSEGWRWYRKLQISDTANVSADYQLYLRLYENDSTKDSPGDSTLDLANKCNSFPNDIRFGTTNNPSTATQLKQEIWQEKDWEYESKSGDVNGHQGVCSDGTYFYVIDTNAIRKYDKNWNLVAENTDPTGDINSYLNDGVNRTHLGDGDYYNGKIYVVCEIWTDDPTDYDDSQSPTQGQCIGIFNASDLLLDSAFTMEKGHEVSGCHINPNDGDNGIIYVTSYVRSDGTDNWDCPKIYKYDLSTHDYLGYIGIGNGIVAQQGITEHNGKFYIASDAKGAENTAKFIVKVEKNTGNFLGYEFHGVGGSHEGLDVYEDNGITKLAYLIDEGATERVWIYKYNPFVDVFVKLPSDGSDAIYLFVGNENANKYSSGSDTNIAFDDFNDNDFSNWNSMGSSATFSMIEKSGLKYAKLDAGTTTGNNRWKYLDVDVSPPYIVEAWVDEHDTSYSCVLRLAFGIDTTNTRSYCIASEGSSAWTYKKISRIWNATGYEHFVSQSINIPKKGWYLLRAKVKGDTIYYELYDGDLNLLESASGTDTTWTKSGKVGIGIWRRYGYFKDFRVRKWADTEPTWASFRQWRSIARKHIAQPSRFFMKHLRRGV
ncbi:MAG: DUF2341 domain-containing protein [Methanotrichaceae archaeon]